MVLKIKNIPPFKRGKHLNTNILSEIKFDFLEIQKKGDKLEI